MRRGLSARLISTSYLSSFFFFCRVLPGVVGDEIRAGCLLTSNFFLFLSLTHQKCSLLRTEGQADVFQCRRWNPDSEDSSSSEDEDEDDDEDLYYSFQ
jgi:hypothetical protein